MNAAGIKHNDGTEACFRAIVALTGLKSRLAKRHNNVGLGLVKVELAFLGEPAQGCMQLVDLEFCCFAQFFQGKTPVRDKKLSKIVV